LNYYVLHLRGKGAPEVGGEAKRVRGFFTSLSCLGKRGIKWREAGRCRTSQKRARCSWRILRALLVQIMEEGVAKEMLKMGRKRRLESRTYLRGVGGRGLGLRNLRAVRRKLFANDEKGGGRSRTV